MTKRRSKVVSKGMVEIEKHLQANRVQFDKYIAKEMERERKTVERGMVYWINT